MSHKSYYDPHYKPDRTAAKYRADQRRDAASTTENAAFVAEFLANYRPGPTGSPDPAATFKALRIEARQLSKGKGKPKNELTKEQKTKRKLNNELAKEQKTKRKRKLAGAAEKAGRTERGKTRAERQGTHPWLKRKGSLRYLQFTDEELLTEFFSVASKIDRWREERAASVDEKRKAVLAGQVQIQYEKRHDLLTLIYYRALDFDDQTTTCT